MPRAGMIEAVLAVTNQVHAEARSRRAEIVVAIRVANAAVDAPTAGHRHPARRQRHRNAAMAASAHRLRRTHDQIAAINGKGAAAKANLLLVQAAGGGAAHQARMPAVDALADPVATQVALSLADRVTRLAADARTDLAVPPVVADLAGPMAIWVADAPADPAVTPVADALDGLMAIWAADALADPMSMWVADAREDLAAIPAADALADLTPTPAVDARTGPAVTPVVADIARNR